MWNKSANFLMVKVKMKKPWGFTLPVPLGVVDVLFEAIADLTWVGEGMLKIVPLPQEEQARKQLSWVKRISPSELLSQTAYILNDLRKYKGLDVVDVDTKDVRVLIYLR